MHEEHALEQDLKAEAQRISEKLGGPPVVIVVAGQEGIAARTMTGSWSPQPLRLRDLLGILQASIQVESWKHLRNWL